MSEFVKRKLGVAEFNDADVFYEFTGEENLLYCREVIYKTRKEGTLDTVRATLNSHDI